MWAWPGTRVTASSITTPRTRAGVGLWYVLTEGYVNVELTMFRAVEDLSSHLAKCLSTLFTASHAVLPQPCRAMPASSLTLGFPVGYLFSYDCAYLLLGHHSSCATSNTDLTYPPAVSQNKWPATKPMKFVQRMKGNAFQPKYMGSRISPVTKQVVVKATIGQTRHG